MSKRTFLIHGWDGRPDNHWFPWLKAELVARGFEVFAPAMPNHAYPKISEWVSMLNDWVGEPDEETFLVGHSIGCQTILRYLETVPNAKIGGAVFVAGWLSLQNLSSNEIKVAKPWLETAIDFGKLKTWARTFVALMSDNDQSVSLEQGIEFANKIGAKVILEKGKGHFTKADGVTALPSVLSALLAMSAL
ncbi:MAG: hypothetical protein G01um101472_169 [Parcubacteria group bacterium Gr01-1014_72]|nr:MAG: hypothetical protein G01um101472_169 [Parcubacteria group bacterium Gr01-1014_72]